MFPVLDPPEEVREVPPSELKYQFKQKLHARQQQNPTTHGQKQYKHSLSTKCVYCERFRYKIFIFHDSREKRLPYNEIMS